MRTLFASVSPLAAAVGLLSFACGTSTPSVDAFGANDSTAGGASGGGGGVGGVSGSGGSPMAGGSGGAGVPAASYLELALKAQCAWFSRCGILPSAEICEKVYLVSPGAGDIPTTVQDDIATGRVLYDATRAAACWSTVASTPCTYSGRRALGAQSVCLDVLKGTLPDGSACFSNVECEGGNCLAPSCGDACCLGACGPPVARGEGYACRTSGDCDRDFYCDASARPSPICKHVSAAGSACTEWDQCADGLACAGPSGAMTCVPYPADGEFCDGNSPDCDSSHSYCDAKEMRCQSRRPPGSPCTATGTLDSSGSECEISSLCISGVCRAFVGPGDACDASPSSPLGRCLGGLCVDQVCATPSVPVSCWKK